MNSLRSSAAGILIAVSAISISSAAECHIDRPIRVQNLSGLPSEIWTLLGGDVTGVDGVADNGGAFNATDLISEALPMRRFMFANLGENCAVVSVEFGGRGHRIENYPFVLIEGHWQKGSLPY